ncbi:hypothetical protein BLNAU_14312 [Blattamonas nauphoetae]|uniref:Uncharacterized protein n=1 Tax=Blattamonas nauphoetae TaxID=2049346 RepID=A0ABQ9XE83_9EUKA|nr:hypothetical protein BLNAU_14312 [Blattamonas nauphoetae]
MSRLPLTTHLALNTTHLALITTIFIFQTNGPPHHLNQLGEIKHLVLADATEKQDKPQQQKPIQQQKQNQTSSLNTSSFSYKPPLTPLDQTSSSASKRAGSLTDLLLEKEQFQQTHSSPARQVNLAPNIHNTLSTHHPTQPKTPPTTRPPTNHHQLPERTEPPEKERRRHEDPKENEKETEPDSDGSNDKSRKGQSTEEIDDKIWMKEEKHPKDTDSEEGKDVVDKTGEIERLSPDPNQTNASNHQPSSFFSFHSLTSFFSRPWKRNREAEVKKQVIQRKDPDENKTRTNTTE